MSLVFTDAEIMEFDNTRFDLEDGDYMAEIKEFKFIQKEESGSKLMLVNFFIPSEKITKAQWFPLEQNGFLRLKYFLASVGINPSIKLNQIENAVQNVAGDQVRIVLKTNTASNGKSYQNLMVAAHFPKAQSIESQAQNGVSFDPKSNTKIDFNDDIPF